MTERVQAVMVSRHNGAWLVYLTRTDATEHLTPMEQFNCASSLRVAKRIARDDAIALGYQAPFRWEKSGTHSWDLIATWDDDEATKRERRQHAEAFGYEVDDDD